MLSGKGTLFELKEVKKFKVVPNLKTHTANKMTQAMTGNTSLFQSKENSCAMLIAIVLLFITTHSFRLAIKVFEAVMPNMNTVENYVRCFMLGR